MFWNGHHNEVLKQCIIGVLSLCFYAQRRRKNDASKQSSTDVLKRLSYRCVWQWLGQLVFQTPILSPAGMANTKECCILLQLCLAMFYQLEGSLVIKRYGLLDKIEEGISRLEAPAAKGVISGLPWEPGPAEVVFPKNLFLPFVRFFLNCLCPFITPSSAPITIRPFQLSFHS